MSKQHNWEVPEIDLNLRHYSGHPSDVIKKLKYDIEKYLMNENIPQKNREIYSAIFNALDYYKMISYLPAADFSTDDSFLSCSIKEFNKDYKYLSKYNPTNSTEKPENNVIQMNARIKSPLSFMEKVKEKVDEYLTDNRDFTHFNESLRDLIGVRVIVNPPEEIQKQGLQAESDYLHKVYCDFLNYHGINEKNQTNLEEGNYKFIPVNTAHEPQKLEKIKTRITQEGFSEDVKDKFIPKHRIPQMEQPNIDSVTKDYDMYPKYSGYRSIHVCVTPYYSDYIEHLELPPYIIPPANFDYSLEYQFRTQKEDDYAEHGPASHKKSYKPTENVYHRMAVPFFIDFDDPEDLLDDSYKSNNNNSSKKALRKKELRLRNFGESFKKFYGYTFKSRFNISFKEFRDRFSFQDRNDILADKKRVVYDKEHKSYTLETLPVPLYLDMTEQGLFSHILDDNKDSELMEILDRYLISDSVINVYTDSENNKIRSFYNHMPLNIFKVEYVNPTELIHEPEYIDQSEQENDNESESNITNSQTNINQSESTDITSQQKNSSNKSFSDNDGHFEH